MTHTWNFTAPSLPSNVSFTRNTQGQVLGLLQVSGNDNEGYYHSVTQQFGINKVPDLPNLSPTNINGNSVNLIYNSSGATDYTIYYATHTGSPYNGTGANQGPSPIDAGTSTIFQVSGLQQCVPYYFAVQGTNSTGSGGLSNECKIILFDAGNQQPIDYYLNDLDISYNYTLPRNSYFASNLIIEPGYTLTVNGSYLYFDKGSKIVVKQGGKLILNGTTCTSPCGQSWKGIEVWGDYNQNQYTINGQCAQGTLELTNGTVIENADNAIALWHPGDYYTSGGIVTATNSIFKNDKRVAEFISYTNHHPINGQPTDYISSFTNCQFITDNNYLNSSPFYAFITMWDVKGIDITACNFSNSTSYNASINRGYGIYSIDAGYIVKSTCTSNLFPCPPANSIPSTFQGLYAGIYALAASTTNTINVCQSQFTDNSYGVRLSAVNNATITQDTFDIGTNIICPNFTGIGIEMNNCTGYKIEENHFKHTEYTNQGDNYVGIRVIGQSNPMSVSYNEIYLNTFNGINVGNQAEQANYNPGIQTGLCYVCNKNSNNTYDFNVKDWGVAQYQGSYSMPAGNIFSKNANNPYSDFNNNAFWGIWYRYYNGDPTQLPESVFNVITQNTSNQNTCPSHFGNNGGAIDKLTGGQISDLQQTYAYNTDAYNNTLNLFETLKDGGSTSGLNLDITASTPDQTMELRDELLGKSPHLSEEILKAAADKTEVLPDPILFEILAANPDELRNGELLTYLKEKSHPLPDYMIDLLSAIASDSS